MKLIKLERCGVTVNPDHIVGIEEVAFKDIVDKISSNHKEFFDAYTDDELKELGLRPDPHLPGDNDIRFGNCFYRHYSNNDSNKIIFWKLHMTFKTFVIGVKDYVKIISNVDFS